MIAPISDFNHHLEMFKGELYKKGSYIPDIT